MKPCFMWVGSVLLAMLITGCDLDPVAWGDSDYKPLQEPDDVSLLDGGDLDGGDTETETETE